MSDVRTNPVVLPTVRAQESEQTRTKTLLRTEKAATDETEEVEKPKTGIYNVHTEEGRAQFKQALLDVGLTLPHFMNVDASSMGLTAGQMTELGELGEIAGAFTAPGSQTPKGMAGLESRWSAFVSGVQVGQGMDVNALVQFVLREAYMENTKDLHFYAQKVRYFNEQKKMIREHLNQTRQWYSNVKAEYLNRYGTLGTPPSAQEQAQMTEVMMDMAINTGSQAWLNVRSHATVLSAQDVTQNFADRMMDKFGLDNVPQALKDEINRLLSPPTSDANVKSAVELAARFIGFCSDRGLKDGKWQGQPGSCDDYAGPYLSGSKGGEITNVEAMWDEFQAYQGSTASTNLASGDIELLIAAFDVDPKNVSFTGSTSQDSIVAQVTNAVNDRWANEMFVGTSHSTADLSNIAASGKWDDPELIKIFGTAEAAQQAFWGDPEERQRQIELGIPNGLPPPGVTNFEQLETHIQNMEEKLNSVGDDAQLANVDLQNMLQKQQQTLQMMSNIAKMLHDTAMAVIRKIGA